jgi:protein-disulfide isomerase
VIRALARHRSPATIATAIRSGFSSEVSVPLSRRQALAGLTALVLAGTTALAQTVDLAELSAPGPLADQTVGSATAPVTIVEYASVTCPHCATFHVETYPKLKEKYIDTGKVRLIFREFPTGPVNASIAGFMLARCSGDKYFPMIGAMFEQQQSWTANPYEGLLRIARQAGMTQESFETCLKDRKLANDIVESGRRAVEKFRVESTPTFFVNGTKIVGAQPLAAFEKAIEAVLKTN